MGMEKQGLNTRDQAWIRVLRIGFGLIFLWLMWKAWPEVKIENSLEAWLPPSSTEMTDYQEFLADFGSDAGLILAISPPADQYAEADQLLAEQMKFVRSLPVVNQVSAWPPPFLKLKSAPSENHISYLINFDPGSQLDPLHTRLLGQVDSLLQLLPYPSYLAGTGVFHREINLQTQRHIVLYLSIGMAILLIVLFLMVRSLKGVLLTLLVSAGGVCSMILTAYVFAIPIGMIHSILPMLILFYGTSISLHLFSHQGDFRKVLVPSLLAGITTSVGFSVFLLDEIPLLRDFALLSLGGIGGEFLWALVLFYPHTFRHQLSPGLNRLFIKVKVLRWPVFLALIGMLLLISLPGLSRLKVDIYSLNVLPKNSKAVADHHFIEQEVSSYFPLEYVVERPKVKLKAMQAWIDAVMKLDQVDGVVSFHLFPKLLNPRDFGYRARSKAPRFRVTFLTQLLSTSQSEKLTQKIDELAGKELQGYHPHLTGNVSLYSMVANRLGKSFRQSLLIAFGLIFLIIGWYLRNFWLAGAAFLTNALPILLIIGLMGWFRIYLDMITVPIGCLMLGIVVDDTIHFLYWYHKKRELAATFHHAGPGILFTTIILVAGFGVLISSPAPPVRYFGILSVIALLGALISDLVLLPALLKKLEALNLIRSQRDGKH